MKNRLYINTFESTSVCYKVSSNEFVEYLDKGSGTLKVSTYDLSQLEQEYWGVYKVFEKILEYEE